MIENLDMDGLRAFVAIADTMSFSRAGDVIGRAQPTVSLRLRRLERAVGVSLLIRRQGRVIDLTADGRALLDYARRIIAINDQALRDLGSGSDGGRVRVGLPADFVDLGLGQAIRQVLASFPGVQVEVETDVSQTLYGRCLGGELDVVFYKGTEGGRGQTLRPVPLAWAGAAASRTTGAELAVAAFPEGCAYRRRMIEALDRAGVGYRVILTTPSQHSLRQALVGGVAVSALPVEMVEDDEGLHRLDTLPPLRPVTLAVLRSPGHAAVVARVTECLISRMMG